MAESVSPGERFDDTVFDIQSAIRALKNAPWPSREMWLLRAPVQDD
jgi:hypothetical protein